MRLILIAAAAAMISVSALALPVTPVITTTPGAPYNTDALTGFTTTGANMAGSRVRVTFSDLSTETATWATTGPAAGEARGSDFLLALDGDSFVATWTLTNIGPDLGIVAFSFDGVPGNTVFDIVSGPTDSPGSANGQPLSNADSQYPGDISVLYTNRLTVGGIFYSDLYTRLEVSGFVIAPDYQLTYVSDTDNALGKIDVPAPASFGLFGLGVTMLGLRRRRA